MKLKTNRKGKYVHRQDEGMNIKALKNILEELADSHQANHNITFNIVMKQYDHD
mgnify:CR=1 FL=1|tara:strand:- start:770 stop:931 length:162 start_codon:yes stop_codon:yes gene_type:complete